MRIPFNSARRSGGFRPAVPVIAAGGRSDDADIVNTTISVIGKKTGASFVVLWPIGFTALEAVFNLAPELYAHEVVGFVPSVGCHGRETA